MNIYTKDRAPDSFDANLPKNTRTNNNKIAIDDLETLVLFAIDPPSKINVRWENTNNLVQAKSALQCYRFDDAEPRLAYTFDLLDDGRLFTTDHRMLINHPSDIIGDGAETIMFDYNGNVVKWMKIEPCKKPSRGFVTIGKADKWYAVHFRAGNPKQGWSDYIKGYSAINKDGKQIPVKWMQENRYDCYDRKRESDQIILVCSIIEDAHRAGAFLVSAKLGSEIRFPVRYDDYIDFFKLREAPRNTPTGKRNPILHWVASHIRKTQKGKEAHVKKHMRGVSEVEIDGITARITPNETRDGALREFSA
jgi:hypothetical protein